MASLVSYPDLPSTLHGGSGNETMAGPASFLRIHSGCNGCLVVIAVSLCVQAPKSEYVPFPHYQRVMKAKRAKEKRLAEEVRNTSCFVVLQFPLPSKPHQAM